MPRVMIRYLSMECTFKLNMFPAKGGISPYYSPQVLLNQQTLDYKNKCQVSFGAYVQHQCPMYIGCYLFVTSSKYVGWP